MTKARTVRVILRALLAGCIWHVWVTSVHAEQPHWLWHTSRATNQFRLTRSISLPSPVESVRVWLGVDFCHATLVVNGKTVDGIRAYDPRGWIESNQHWKVGRNEVVVHCQAVPGASAIAVAIIARFRNGKSASWLSNKSWPGKSGKSYGAVSLARFEPFAHSIEVDSFDDYTQWKQASGAAQAADPSRFLTARGFQIQLVKAAGKKDGSWISLAFDNKGRALVSREDQGIWRMTLDKSGQRVTSLDLVNRNLRECRGLLFAHGALYASANNDRSLYRLRDTDKDDVFDEVKKLRTLPGGVGHGRNDLTLGPDGKIYWICGDSVQIPRRRVRDFTAPTREHRRGKKTSEGFVLRTDADGQQWEVLAAGLRNPYGIAVNSVGDLFTYDADAEFDMGSPWYRPTRVVQIQPGADYGWRGVTGRWPPYYPDHPDNGVPILDIGKGSPTAVAFGQAGQFPNPYDKALFILDWAYGRIIAVHCVRRGASYVCRPETFIKGRPFNVTDLAFAPDGSLYVITGGRGTRSAMYRVQFVGQAPRQTRMTAQRAARLVTSARHQLLRKRMEAKLLNPTRKVVADAVDRLAAADPYLRYAARQILEHARDDGGLSIALQSKNGRRRLAALITLARRQKLTPSSLLRHLQGVELHKEPADVHQLALHVCKLVTSKAKPNAAEASAMATMIGKLFPSKAKSRRLAALIDRSSAELLLKLSPQEHTPKVVRLLRKPQSQADLMHYLFVLRDVQDGWTPTDRRTYFSTLQSTNLFRGGQGLPGFLRSIRKDATARLTAEQKKRLGSLLTQKQFQFQAISSSRKRVKTWSMKDWSGSLNGGDAGRGRKIFQQAICVNCHRKRDFGFPVGPDLTSVGRRFSRRDTLRSILEPDAVVAENYRTVQVVTSQGKVHSGRIVMAGDYRLPTLRLNTDPFDFTKVVNIPKKEIVSYRRPKVSPMPKGLLDRFTRQEILDLLAYLAN